MSQTVCRLLRWGSRVLAIGMILFLAVFALDGLGEGSGAFLVHLAPALLLLLTVALAWRREWIGGLVFLAAAVLYAGTTMRRPDWILAISGPMFVIGALFLGSWRCRRGGERDGSSVSPQPDSGHTAGGAVR